jgi:hypothetical protein
MVSEPFGGCNQDFLFGGGPKYEQEANASFKEKFKIQGGP